jgi:DNA processing protein
VTARPEHFPRRNRIISGLSLGVLVVEAALQSGSLITARLAAEQGREVFAMPGSIHNPLARGCHRLIRDGARLVESADDIIEELRPQLLAALTPGSGALHHAGVPARDSGIAPSAPAPVELDEDYRKLLDQLDYQPVAVDTLVERTGLTVDVVSSMLLILELHGFASVAPGGRYTRAPVEER